MYKTNKITYLVEKKSIFEKPVLLLFTMNTISIYKGF